MLVSMKEILDRASKENYAIIAPDVFGDIDARSTIEVAEELNSPMIFNVTFDAVPDIAQYGQILAPMCRRAKVPVAINLDHGGNSEKGALYETLMAVKGQFTSVMIDRSALSYEENVKQVKEIVDIVKPLNISVEAEIGHVGKGTDSAEEINSHLTEPEMAKRYFDDSGVDCLAVAIGTAHGAYGGHTPKIDFDRLAAIKEATGAPLVLHGGSGSGYDNIKKVCSMGINKVNVCNELMACMVEAIRSKDLDGNGAYGLWKAAMKAWKERLRFLMELSGSEGKAWNALPEGFTSEETNV